jgi:hypothetical protein
LEQEFTILENKIVGRNLYKFRKVSDVIQKVAQYLKVDPLNIIAAPPGTFFESGNNSPGAIVGNNNVQTMSDEQTRLLTKLIETQIAMNEKILVLLEKK